MSSQDTSSSPLFGDSSESEISDRPRKVSIMEPIWKRQRERRRAEMTQTAPVPNVPDLPYSVPTPSSSHKIDDCSYLSTRLLIYYLNGQLHFYGHDHKKLVLDRWLRKCMTPCPPTLDFGSDDESNTLPPSDETSYVSHHNTNFTDDDKKIHSPLAKRQCYVHATTCPFPPQNRIIPL
jgi:hypothetical protein